jgi:hypothetical protein
MEIVDSRPYLLDGSGNDNGVVDSWHGLLLFPVRGGGGNSACTALKYKALKELEFDPRFFPSGFE